MEIAKLLPQPPLVQRLGNRLLAQKAPEGMDFLMIAGEKCHLLRKSLCMSLEFLLQKWMLWLPKLQES
jgi:diphthamide synthase (EF-2-diphthine--ammonia ligase)